MRVVTEALELIIDIFYFAFNNYKIKRIKINKQYIHIE